MKTLTVRMRNWKFSHVDASKLEIPADCYSVQSVFVRSCEYSVWSKLSLYVVACYFTQKIQISPNGPSTPLYTLGSFGCLLLSSLLTFCWAFVRLQFDDCTFLVLFLLWLGSIIQRDRLLCLARSLLGTLADILIGLLSQFQWKALIFDIDILLFSSLNIPHLMLYLCLVREWRMLHIQNWKCSCQKIILLTIQNTHPKIFSSSIFRIDFSSELLKASSARLRGFKYISKLAWF